jgi:uncharacterized NAD(P)/FAD-binding protein YdhS
MSERQLAESADVAIIGGGFSGTMVAAHLLRRARGPMTVAIVERRPEIGQGVAYGTDEACHLLNVPASAMSAWPDEPGHFLAWLRTQPGFEEAAPSTFAPRRVYGRYVQAVLAEAEADAAEGVRLLRVRDEAVGLRLVPDGAVIALADGHELSARRVVLALGHFPPADPPVPGAASFYASDRYVAEPWARGAIEAIAPTDDVLLIGAGLTAIDWVLSLSARGHQGRVHMLSRKGRLPQPHVPGLLPRPSTLPEPPHRALATWDWVRERVREAEAEGADWRQVVDGLRPHLQGLWGGLDEAERRRFLRHARPLWEVHRHRMAPEVAEAVKRAQGEGRLVVRAGRVVAFQALPDGVEVRLLGDRAPIRVQHVVNCTGPEADFRKKRHPLPVSLMEQGLIRPDALGMGIDTDERGAVLDAHGRASAVIFAIGPMRKGQLWETTAVPEIRGQTQSLGCTLTGGT